MGSDGRATRGGGEAAQLLRVDCLLPATNPTEIAKAMALVLAPVDVPISALVEARAFLCPTGLMNPFASGRRVICRRVMSGDKKRVVRGFAEKVQNAVPSAH